MFDIRLISVLQHVKKTFEHQEASMLASYDSTLTKFIQRINQLVRQILTELVVSSDIFLSILLALLI